MGYAVKLAPVAKQIYNGDKVDVALTGSNTGTYTFSVCYVSKTEVCLLCDVNLGNANWTTQCAKSWGWSLKLGGKNYSSSDAGQSVAKIPTLVDVQNHCTDPIRDFIYYLQDNYGGTGNAYAYAQQYFTSTSGQMAMPSYYNKSSNAASTPFITITT